MSYDFFITISPSCFYLMADNFRESGAYLV